MKWQKYGAKNNHFNFTRKTLVEVDIKVFDILTKSRADKSCLFSSLKTHMLCIYRVKEVLIMLLIRRVIIELIEQKKTKNVEFKLL